MNYPPPLLPDLIIPFPGELRTAVDWDHWRANVAPSCRRMTSNFRITWCYPKSTRH